MFECFVLVKVALRIKQIKYLINKVFWITLASPKVSSAENVKGRQESHSQNTERWHDETPFGTNKELRRIAFSTASSSHSTNTSK